MIVTLNDSEKTMLILTPGTPILVKAESKRQIDIYMGQDPAVRLYYYGDETGRMKDLVIIDKYLTYDITNPLHSAHFI